MGVVKIHAPNPRYCGRVGGIAFECGTAVVDEAEYPDELTYMRKRAGYRIEPTSEEPQQRPGPYGHAEHETLGHPLEDVVTQTRGCP